MAQITCARCGNSRESAGRTGLPAPLGPEIEARICAECWTEWLAHQIRGINHHPPPPAPPQDREKPFPFPRGFPNLATQEPHPSSTERAAPTPTPPPHADAGGGSH